MFHSSHTFILFIFGMQISPETLHNASESDNFRPLALSDPCRVCIAPLDKQMSQYIDSAKAFNVRDVTYITCNCLLVGKSEGQSFEISCCAYGCVNRHGNRKGLGFFRFPVLPEGRRRQWIAAVKRKDWKPTKHTRICEEHFTTGKE